MKILLLRKYNSTMHQLIYLSSASFLYAEQELIKILIKSRENNSKLDITGLLLYNEGSILQILEGEKDVIYKLFETISKDSRHRSIIKLIDYSISERSFKEWAMGFKQLSDIDWLELQGHLNLKDKSVLKGLTHLGSKAVISVIKSFAHVNALSIS